jgi:hypothetical protein
MEAVESWEDGSFDWGELIAAPLRDEEHCLHWVLDFAQCDTLDLGLEADSRTTKKGIGLVTDLQEDGRSVHE